jgi:hypothetical protein
MTERPVSAVLFDPDGVLSRTDTMTTLVTGQLGHKPARLITALPLVPVSYLCSPGSRLKAAPNRRIVAISLRGISASRYRAIAEQTAHHLATHPGNVPATAGAALHTATASGRVLVITATKHHRTI